MNSLRALLAVYPEETAAALLRLRDRVADDPERSAAADRLITAAATRLRATHGPAAAGPLATFTRLPATQQPDRLRTLAAELSERGAAERRRVAAGTATAGAADPRAVCTAAAGLMALPGQELQQLHAAWWRGLQQPVPATVTGRREAAQHRRALPLVEAVMQTRGIPQLEDEAARLRRHQKTGGLQL